MVGVPLGDQIVAGFANVLTIDNLPGKSAEGIECRQEVAEAIVTRDPAQ